MKIAIFGLGYVGVVNMGCFSKLGHHVYGCDVKSQKVELIRQGKSPIFEPQVDEMLADGLSKGLINASVKAQEVLEATDIALVCVGTPSRTDGTVNLDYTINTTHEIASYIRKSGKKYTVVFRSTIPPGTIENSILPEFESILGEKFPLLTVAFLPEFLREGSAVKDFFHCSRIVVGIADEKNADLEKLLSYSPDIPIVFTNYRTAEFIKYVDNAFHAMKISFVNETYRLGSAYDVDTEIANKIFLMDKHLNISETYLRPGLPFGGSCLPKDLRAINHLAREKNIELPVLGSILKSNADHITSMLEKVKNYGRKRIALYGLTFKSGTDDVRESPMLLLAERLSSEGFSLKVFDQDINVSSLRIEQPGIIKHIAASAAETFGDADLVLVCKKGFKKFTGAISPGAIVINFFDQEKFAIANSQETFY
ncbi:MAG: nucleotide sugar dehydrogenase [Crocinitomicaceae bacterium]|nr:nucleotide sugar dehydrogenase [Crocinitomicaceae bacterium]